MTAGNIAVNETQLLLPPAALLGCRWRGQYGATEKAEPIIKLHEVPGHTKSLAHVMLKSGEAARSRSCVKAGLIKLNDKRKH
ncbi:uncharacterized [Tachysurus ichikawai]